MHAIADFIAKNTVRITAFASASLVVFMIVLQGRCVVLTAMEQPNDRDLSWVLVHRVRDDRAAAVMADTQTGPDVFRGVPR